LKKREIFLFYTKIYFFLKHNSRSFVVHTLLFFVFNFFYLFPFQEILFPRNRFEKKVFSFLNLGRFLKKKKGGFIFCESSARRVFSHIFVCCFSLKVFFNKKKNTHKKREKTFAFWQLLNYAGTKYKNKKKVTF